MWGWSFLSPVDMICVCEKTQWLFRNSTGWTNKSAQVMQCCRITTLLEHEIYTRTGKSDCGRVSPATRHLSGFPWGPPTQDTGRCCSRCLLEFQAVGIRRADGTSCHDSGSSSSVCVDGWFILGAMIAHAPQVCSPTQPESNQAR